MIDLLVFVPACFALNMAFGPNNLLALNHGAQSGVSLAFRAALARLLAFVLMITISALGMGILLSASATVFTALKLAGAAYLIWLGWRLLKSSSKMQATAIAHGFATVGEAFRREGLVAIGNPKAILIFAAFFPQFVNVDSYAASYVALGAIFIALEVVAILIYAMIGRYAARFAASRLHWFQRASGMGMIVFGFLLLLTRRPPQVAA